MKMTALYMKLYWQTSQGKSRWKQLCKLERAEETFQVVSESYWQVTQGKLQMSATIINPLSTKITLATYDLKSVSATNSKLSAHDPKVMSCCLRSFVVTKTYSIKQLYPQPQKCLSQFGAEMYWQNNRKKFILQPDMFYLCSSQKLCALRALHLAHF